LPSWSIAADAANVSARETSESASTSTQPAVLGGLDRAASAAGSPCRRIRSKAPLRLSFCGGGTDVPPYATEQGGAVLSATVDRYAYATLVDDGRRELVVRSLDLNLTKQFDLETPMVYDGQLDLVKAAFQWLNKHGPNAKISGCELQLHTDAPPGSGLGSSSAVVVAMVNALAGWRQIPLTAYESARLAYILEREELGIAGGMQDQYSATFGGFNFMEFGAQGVVVNPLRISNETINELQYCLVLCYAGGTRLSSNIIEEQVDNYQSRDAAALAAMAQLKELTTAMKNALVLGELDEFGSLLDEAWVNKKQMATQVTNSFLDELYEEAKSSGALGGKVSGAGGGGYMFFFCPGETRHRVSQRLDELGAKVTRFAFEPNGVQTWSTTFRTRGARPSGE
jgi:D-glycero-alpha-D-manno-heptose-7-phosphate kinase